MKKKHKNPPSWNSVGYKRFEKWLSKSIWWQDANGRWSIIKDNHIKN